MVKPMGKGSSDFGIVLPEILQLMAPKLSVFLPEAFKSAGIWELKHYLMQSWMQLNLSVRC